MVAGSLATGWAEPPLATRSANRGERDIDRAASLEVAGYDMHCSLSIRTPFRRQEKLLAKGGYVLDDPLATVVGDDRQVDVSWPITRIEIAF